MSKEDPCWRNDCVVSSLDVVKAIVNEGVDRLFLELAGDEISKSWDYAKATGTPSATIMKLDAFVNGIKYEAIDLAAILGFALALVPHETLTFEEWLTAAIKVSKLDTYQPDIDFDEFINSHKKEE